MKKLMTSHEADHDGKVRWSRGKLYERAHDFEVERSRIHLPDTVECCGKTKVFSDAFFELKHSLGASQKIHHVLLGASRSFDATQWIACNEIFEAIECNE